MGQTHTPENYSARKRKDVLTRTTTQMEPEDTVLSEISQREDRILYNSISMKPPGQENPQSQKSAKGFDGMEGVGGKWGMIANRYKVSFWDDKNILISIVVITAQLNILKASQLYTLNWWVVGYVNCISITLLLKQTKCKKTATWCLRHRDTTHVFSSAHARLCMGPEVQGYRGILPVQTMVETLKDVSFMQRRQRRAAQVTFSLARVVREAKCRISDWRLQRARSFHRTRGVGSEGPVAGSAEAQAGAATPLSSWAAQPELTTPCSSGWVSRMSFQPQSQPSASRHRLTWGRVSPSQTAHVTLLLPGFVLGLVCCCLVVPPNQVSKTSPAHPWSHSSLVKSASYLHLTIHG